MAIEDDAGRAAQVVSAGARTPGVRYLPIAEHGLIGDLHTVALVGTDGTIDWYCCPRFDSPSVFGSILDADRGGAFRVSPDCDGWSSKQLYWCLTGLRTAPSRYSPQWRPTTYLCSGRGRSCLPGFPVLVPHGSADRSLGQLPDGFSSSLTMDPPGRLIVRRSHGATRVRDAGDALAALDGFGRMTKRERGAVSAQPPVGGVKKPRRPWLKFATTSSVNDILTGVVLMADA